jgi:dCMP deaminase
VSSRPSWDEYFLLLVDAAARRASCDRGRCGAVFVRDNDVLATGYVGAPPGQPDCFEAGHLMMATTTFLDGGTSTGSKHCVRTIHAEQNGIIRAARNGVLLRGATVYCTMEPCLNCAMSLVGIGIKRFVAKNSYHAAHRSRDLFASSDILLEVKSQDVLY